MKILLRTLLVLAIIVLGLATYVNLVYDKNFKDTPYPDVKASKDSAVIARGKYLVFGPAHCAVCHVNVGQDQEVDAGKELPLIGGFEIHLPIGTLRTRNLTSDKETGIGALTDAQIARMLRYNVKHDDIAAIPLMPFQETSEEDIVAIISYLRTMPPVRHEVKPTEYNFIGKIVKTFILKPSMPTNKPPQMIHKDTSVEYGKYLAMSVSNCYGCHTDRNLKTGEFTGKPFAGGLGFPPVPEDLNYGFVTPNLTPDRETGRMADWNEEAFIKRFRAGRLKKGSPMPWGPFSRMDESDLKAIYRYLQTVTAVKNAVEKTVYAPGEKMPEPKS